MSEGQGARIWQALREDDRALLSRLRAQLAPAARLALVGGAVRDALLGIEPLDLDVVVEGGAVEELARSSGERFTYHPHYDNATLHLQDGRLLDLIRARGETYAHPGAAPGPFPAGLSTDLARRDFSVNAMALDLASQELIDPHGGQADLEQRLLRPLHAQSFRDDPSRLARGARLAARLNFDLAPEGHAQVPDALRYASQTPRLRGELALSFQEPFPGEVFTRLRTWGAGDLFGHDASNPLTKLDEVRRAGGDVPQTVYLAAWLAAQPGPARASHHYLLGERPLALLERAHSKDRFPPSSPETLLRRVLDLPEPPEGLTGTDVLAFGVPPGKQVGQALAYLATLREAGRVHGREDELRELRAYLEGSAQGS